MSPKTLQRDGYGSRQTLPSRWMNFIKFLTDLTFVGKMGPCHLPIRWSPGLFAWSEWHADM